MSRVIVRNATCCVTGNRFTVNLPFVPQCILSWVCDSQMLWSVSTCLIWGVLISFSFAPAFDSTAYHRIRQKNGWSYLFFHVGNMYPFHASIRYPTFPSSGPGLLARHSSRLNSCHVDIRRLWIHVGHLTTWPNLRPPCQPTLGSTHQHWNRSRIVCAAWLPSFDRHCVGHALAVTLLTRALLYKLDVAILCCLRK